MEKKKPTKLIFTITLPSHLLTPQEVQLPAACPHGTVAVVSVPSQPTAQHRSSAPDWVLKVNSALYWGREFSTYSQNQEGLPDPIIFLPSSLWSADCPLHHWAYLICQAQFNQRLFLCSSLLMQVVVFVSSTANNTRLQRNADSHSYNMTYQSCTKVINTLPQSQRAADNLNSFKIPPMLNSLLHLLGLYFTQGTFWGVAILKSWNLHVLRLDERNIVAFQPTASFYWKKFPFFFFYSALINSS